MTKEESTELWKVQHALESMSAPMLAAVAKDALGKLQGRREIGESEIPYVSLDCITDRDPDLK